VCWFRKGLRVHDNPALARAVAHTMESGGVVYPLFIVDPHFGPGKVSAGTTFSSVRA
jgi:deoxyribodipyrimidine photolyase